MQRVFCVRFSGDGSYVFSGSDDMNVRVWKADASEQLGVTLSREKHKSAYNKALINRYKHMPEVRKVVKRRNLPAAIHKVSAHTGYVIPNCQLSTSSRGISLESLESMRWAYEQLPAQARHPHTCILQHVLVPRSSSAHTPAT